MRYLAAELGPEKQVRVNATSAGPIRTLASSAIGGILDMIHNVEEKALAPHRDPDGSGRHRRVPAERSGQRHSGQTIYVDAATA